VAAVTGGEIEVLGARAQDIEVVAAVLKRMQIECRMDGDTFRSSSRGQTAGRITTGLWPGFRAIWSALSRCWRRSARDRRSFTIVARVAPVRSRAVERHERRSVSLRSASHHRDRPRKLRGWPLDSRDLRSGMALTPRRLRLTAELAGPLETVERGSGSW
jgi:UDP-N-acetylglucosamine enolpyruvyl transferase